MPSALPCRLGHWPLALSGLVAALLFPASSALAPQPANQAYAPVEILATHLHEPTGLAKDPDTGGLFVSEADTGVVLRLRTDSQGSTHIETFATGFTRPRGLARDPRDGSLLVVDEKAGTLSRVDRLGAVTRLRDNLKQPHWVAVAEDGTIYLTAEEGAGFKLKGHEEGVLLSFAPDGLNPQLLVKGLKRPGGLRVLPDGRIRFLADRLRSEPEREGGTVFEYTPGEPVQTPVHSGFKRPHDLALDALEATYLTADRQREEGHRDKGVIGKAFGEERVALFATGLKEPRGLTFDPEGNLYVAEADTGRILRFRAPRPPALESPPPAFTQEATLPVTGTAEPNALLTVRGATVPLPPQADVSAQVRVRVSSKRWQPRTGLFVQTLVLTNTGATPLASPLAVVVTSISPAEVTLANATTTVNGSPAVEVPLVEGLLRPGETARIALHFRGLKHNQHLTYTREIWALRPLAVSDAEGHLSFPVTLTPNTENHLGLFATARFGLGLTSAPVKATVLYDSRPPTVYVTKPAPGAFVRGSVEVASEATETMQEEEAWSGVATLSLKQAETALITAPNPTPESPLPHRASTLWETTALPDGPAVLTATATDRAGNTASDSLTVTVDNTPPTVAFSTPNDGATVSGIVTVTVTGSDAIAGLDSLTLEVDGVPRQRSETSPLTYGLNTSALTAGPHTLTATAKDRAGNTASISRTITVQNLLVRIISPVDGASISQDRVRVTGTVEAQGEIGVVVNGVVAFVTGTQWIAEVPLVLGSNDIAVTATDATGAQDTRHITVQVTQVQQPAVALKASPVSGLAPLTVRFEVQSGLDRPIVRYEFDQNGDGTIDLTTSTFDNIEVTYTTPGLLTPTLTVTDDQGRIATATTTLQVLDATATVAMLQAKWDGLKAALAARDIPQATAAIAVGVRARFQAVFQALDADLPSIAPTLGAVAITRVTEGLAEGVVQRVQGGKAYLYFIYWAPDADGIWRIIEM